MRKLVVSVMAATMFLFCSLTFSSASVGSLMLEYDGSTHEYNGEVYSLVVNNQLLDPPLSPIIFNDRALVPVREIFEEVGATVNYIDESQTIEVVGDDTYVELKINDNVAYINGDKTNIPDNVVPKLISKVGGETKTMVPVRFISENIGLDVEFDQDDGAIIIDSDDYSSDIVQKAPIYEEPVPEPSYITGMEYEMIDDNKVSVTITADSDITGYSDFALKAPERIVVDFPGMNLDGVDENTLIGQNGVNGIRFGCDSERARVVIDAENIRSYTVEQTSSNQIVIDVTTRKIIAATSTPVVTKPEPTTVPTPAATPTVKPSSKTYVKNLVVLDAGHGGTDPGAIGTLNGQDVMEKTLTLQITNKVRTILEDAGYTVSMTRTGDTLPSLVERPTQANNENAAVFVSIHINSAEATEAHGTEVYYAESNNDSDYGTTSQKLAKNILTRMLYYMNSTNRGVKSAEHAVTKRCNMPAALAEVGFISNPQEVYNMSTDEYQSKAAQGIAEGIILTLREMNGE